MQVNYQYLGTSYRRQPRAVWRELESRDRLSPEVTAYRVPGRTDKLFSAFPSPLISSSELKRVSLLQCSLHAVTFCILQLPICLFVTYSKVADLASTYLVSGVKA